MINQKVYVTVKESQAFAQTAVTHLRQVSTVHNCAEGGKVCI